uniref:Uncharacterized protein n=1 Tax=Ditylum brightwellii TaxID=49249 RepID=A0A6V2IWU5_9STRA|mmetsp:Transcript_5138/g.6800  ORF Transcript_5138/g.6800 Transcript_5138/m.6800 type:complete len:114 (+) Transcript_5138:83-424(+)
MMRKKTTCLAKMICRYNACVTQQLYLASEKLTIGRQSHVCTWRAFSQLSRSLGRERWAHMRTTRGSKCHDVSPRATHTHHPGGFVGQGQRSPRGPYFFAAHFLMLTHPGIEVI